MMATDFGLNIASSFKTLTPSRPVKEYIVTIKTFEKLYSQIISVITVPFPEKLLNIYHVLLLIPVGPREEDFR